MEAKIRNTKKIMLASAVTAIIAFIVLINIQGVTAEWAGPANHVLAAIIFFALVGFRASMGQMIDFRKMRSN